MSFRCQSCPSRPEHMRHKAYKSIIHERNLRVVKLQNTRFQLTFIWAPRGQTHHQDQCAFLPSDLPKAYNGRRSLAEIRMGPKTDTLIQRLYFCLSAMWPASRCIMLPACITFSSASRTIATHGDMLSQCCGSEPFKMALAEKFGTGNSKSY